MLLSNLIKAPYVQVGNAYKLVPQDTKSQEILLVDEEVCENNAEREVLSKAERLLAAAEVQAEAILAQGKERAEDLCAQAEAEKEKMLKEAYDEGYQAGNTQGYEDGYNAGFVGGEDKAYQDNRNTAQALRDLMAKYDEHWQSLLAEELDDLKYLALEIAEKIVCDHIIIDPEFYENMVDKALDSFRNYQWVDIYIDEQPEVAIRLENHLAKVMTANSAYLRIRQDKDADLGQCVVESDAGVVDASVQTQLAQVKNVLAEKRGMT